MLPKYVAYVSLKHILIDFPPGRKILDLPSRSAYTFTNFVHSYEHLVLQRRQTRVIRNINAYNQIK